MRKLTLGRIRIAVGLVTILVLSSSAFATSISCEARTARVAVLSTELWRPDLGLRAVTAGTFAVNDCIGATERVNLEAGDEIVVQAIDEGHLCGDVGPAAVLEIAVPAGACATYWTDNLFTEPDGDVSLVRIPELGPPVGARRVFRALRNDEELGAFVLLLSSGPMSVRLSAAGQSVEVSVDRFYFAALPWTFEVGDLVVEPLILGGPGAPPRLDAIAVTGAADGGSPAVILGVDE